MLSLVFRYSLLLIVSIMLSTVVGLLSPRLIIPREADRQSVNCTDADPVNCPYWAFLGECKNNPGYMLPNCGGSCNLAQCCTDSNPNCPYWASVGECKNNPGYMLPNCMASCNPERCACRDANPSCPGWAASGECDKNPNYMLFYCKISCQQCEC